MQDHESEHPMIPDWLQTHLASIGRWDTDGVRRAASSKTCRCGQRILAGLDDDVAAWAVTIDPVPLDAAGELQALVSGRKTYRLSHRRDHWEIDRRTDIHIATEPPERVHVLVNHECGNAIPGNGPAITNPRPAASKYTEVPF